MKIIQSNEIKNYVNDGDTLFITGITLGGYADEAVKEIEKSFLENGHPRDLTAYWTSSIGDRGEAGMAHIAHEGLLKRGIGGHLKGCGTNMAEITRDNKAEIFCFPQSVTATMARDISAKKPGVVTKIGLETMMDPRYEGGAMNEKAGKTEPQVELVELLGEEWLLYKLPQVDVTLIRGSIADTKGNISIYREGYKLNQLSAASAAKACGGIVIVQVERIVEAGTIPPKEVAVPGIMVDYVFCAKPENHWQTAQTYYNPSFSGELRVPLNEVEVESLSARKVIARRAAMFMEAGDVCNLGVGIPEAVSSVAAEEGVLSHITLTTEAGNMGGMPANRHDFGCCWNPEATIEMADNFDYYDGGCLNFGCLGILQIGSDGNVNASRLNGEGIGVGGFMDVAAGSKTIVFTTIFVGRVDVKIGDGQLDIIKEGNIKKFINDIEQISFNGRLALKDHKKVYYVTERAVFQLVDEGLELLEIAPGVDLEKDILGQMDFRPIMKNVKQMPVEIFNEEWGGLANIMGIEQRDESEDLYDNER